MLPGDEPPAEAFRVGRGYVDYWIHEAEGHWTLSSDEKTALRSLKEALYGLVARRDALEAARRGFVPVSRLRKGMHVTSETQEALHHAYQDFFGQFYKCLTTLAGFISNFSEAFGQLPSRNSMEKFINWLDQYALFANHTMPLLRDAREFRTLFEHPTLMPLGSTWGTFSETGQPARLFFHGPLRSDGGVPDGALLEPESEITLPAGHEWVRFGPDEDLVLWAIAVQLNALFPRCQSHRQNELKAARCRWEPPFDPDSPDGYPVFAAFEGVVVASSQSSAVLELPKPPRKLPPGLSESEQIEFILKQYFPEEGS